MRQKNAVRFQGLATATFHGQQSVDARKAGYSGSRSPQTGLGGCVVVGGRAAAGRALPRQIAGIVVAALSYLVTFAAPAPAQSPVTSQPAVENVKTITEPVSGTESSWHRRWWIDKTARLLRAGEGLGPDDAIDSLIPLSREGVARQFMADPRWGDAILDFNLFFLGFKSDSIKLDGEYDRAVFDFPNAVGAAQAMLSGGDYFKLFDFEGPFFMAPLRTEALEDAPLPGDAGLSPEQIRKKAIGEFREPLLQLLDTSQSGSSAQARNLCRQTRALTERVEELSGKLFRAFDDAEIFALIRGEVVTAPLGALAALVERECDGKAPSMSAQKRLEEGIRHAVAQIDRAFEEVAKFEPAIYRPRAVSDFKAFDLSAFPTKQKWLSFGFEQGVALGNSSTNFNRKRSAYVLKRFFCDDLIPIGFEAPLEHVGGAHGSQTSCFACHYKLDPMAGFFRSYGAYFFDYSRSEDIIFDDLAAKDRKRYEGAWLAGSKSQRNLNVGYVRSSRWQAQNIYGSSMADLSRIVRTAPEVKRCLMKRLFEYVVAEDQTIDAGYLDHLTRHFEEESATNSSEAIKNAIVRILQSESYNRVDADPKQCYDAAPGASRKEGPPCRVAFILSKNCGQCHYPGYEGPDSAGRLDVNSWIVAPDGANRAFHHVDSSMLQISAHESFARIIERLSTYDAKARMPKGKMMPNHERQELFLWAQEEMTRASRQVTP